jgi:RimJ/RimL family protein N-acetyltransferase
MTERRIETDRLVLRQPIEVDLAAYNAVIGDETDEREHRDALAHWRAHGFGPWIVERAEGDPSGPAEPLGILEVHYAGPGVTGIQPHEIEIGWTIAEAHRGKGLAVEAAQAALEDAFEHARPNHHRSVVAYIRPENEVSQRVAARIGMRHEADGLTRSGDPMQIWRARA